MNRKTFPLCRLFSYCLLLTVFCSLPSACVLFDNTKLEQQRADLAKLRAESEKLRQEAETLRQQSQAVDKEREACNQAFTSFDAGRKAGDSENAVTQYREGLALCPNDDVAHNELGEIYMRLGRKAEAAAEFEAALRINPNFSRAQKNLDSVQ